MSGACVAGKHRECEHMVEDQVVCGCYCHPAEAPHAGHVTRFTGAWFCDTCNSPYCDLA